jgi:hypothetical protein
MEMGRKSSFGNKSEDLPTSGLIAFGIKAKEY